MQIIRGTTPTITINVKSELDFELITEIWLYIAQQNKVKVDKVIEDVTLNDEKKNNYLCSLTGRYISIERGRCDNSVKSVAL